MAATLSSNAEPDLFSREEVDEIMEQIKAGREDPEIRAEIDREFDRESGEAVGVKRILSRGKLSGEQAAIVDKHVDKYTRVLGIEGERPDVRVADVPNADWGGRTAWHPLRPYTSVIQLQKYLFNKRPLTLENTVAHELIHHQNNLAKTDDEIRKFLETGKPPEWWAEKEGHGKAFQEGADRINAFVGIPNYITEQTYTDEEVHKEHKQAEEKEYQAEKKTRLLKQVVIGLGGGLLLFFALRRLFPHGLRGKTPPSQMRPVGSEPSVSGTNPVAPPRSPRTAGQIPSTKHSSQPNTNARGHYGPPKIQRVTDANERGSCGQSTTNERGCYGRP